MNRGQRQVAGNGNVTLEQLARIFQARNGANKRMSQALRTRDPVVTALATAEASNFNRAYAAALRQYKKQQKDAARGRRQQQQQQQQQQQKEPTP